MIAKIISNFGFTIPKEVRERLELTGGNVVEVIINKNSQKTSFITAIQKRNCIRIRNSARKRLNISKGDVIKLEIKKLKGISRSSTIIKDGKIDLLALVPEKTRRGFPIKIFRRGNKIVIWNDIFRGNNSIPITINRFVSPKFCKFLGLIQAEGEKFINRKGGSSLTFTNKFPSLHKVVIDSFHELGINDNKLILRILVPKGTQKELQDKTIDNFLKLTGVKIDKKRIHVNFIDNIKQTFDKNELKIKLIKIKNISFIIKVGRNLLLELILNSISTIRRFLSELNEFDDVTSKMACNFLSGVLIGDGTFGVGIRRKRIKFHMKIKDPDILHLKECEKIFNNLGFKAILKEKIKVFKLIIRCNWDSLLWIVFKNDMLKEHPFDLIKLVLVIHKSKKWRHSIRIKNLNRPISCEKLSKIFGVTKEATGMWLRLREREQLIKKRKIGNKFIWETTDKGKEFQNLLIKIEQLQNKILHLFGTNDFDEVRKIIKTINGNEIFHQDLMIKLFRWVSK